MYNKGRSHGNHMIWLDIYGGEGQRPDTPTYQLFVPYIVVFYHSLITSHQLIYKYVLMFLPTNIYDSNHICWWIRTLADILQISWYDVMRLWQICEAFWWQWQMTKTAGILLLLTIICFHLIFFLQYYIDMWQLIISFKLLFTINIAYVDAFYIF
jgi:hypothetical protein